MINKYFVMVIDGESELRVLAPFYFYSMRFGFTAKGFRADESTIREARNDVLLPRLT